ncbi:MAG: hypothetical protein JST35_05535 [Armatimonadetes bacterium]|nr:hypothetical protein [Armatimonadota bacterium]
MKKKLAFLLSIAVAVALIGCGSGEDKGASDTTPPKGATSVGVKAINTGGGGGVQNSKPEAN